MTTSRRTFILRVWQSEQNGAWHASLVDVLQGEARNFGSLGELYSCLSADLIIANQPEFLHPPAEFDIQSGMA